MRIAVVGLGKIGLPLAVQFARKNHDVIGVDINPKTVDLINRGLEPFPEENQLQEYLTEMVQANKLRATVDYEEAISVADTVVIVVPLFVDTARNPDFSALDQATNLIGKYMKKGTLICYETTLPIGTTRTRFTEVLESISGHKVGEEFFVVFSPERVFTGRIFQDLKKYPKIVGGVTPECGSKGVKFYESVLDFDVRSDLDKPNGVWLVKNSETAEFVKLAETTYRDVNIALANEFALHAEVKGVDIYEVIDSANSQIFSHIHQPGISVGGHCIPIYPQFYTWGDPDSVIVKTTRRVNENMPRHVVSLIKEEFGELTESKVLILGLSYRPNVKESAFSGTFDVASILENENANVQVLDPYYSENEIKNFGLEPYDGIIANIDVIIIHTAHNEFKEFFKQNLPHSLFVYDGRNLFANESKPNKINLKVLGKSETYKGGKSEHRG
jgi:nucleotide sugar dehydrogenase